MEESAFFIGLLLICASAMMLVVPKLLRKKLSIGHVAGSCAIFAWGIGTMVGSVI